jgi:hypothetical protein
MFATGENKKRFYRNENKARLAEEAKAADE